MAGFVDVSNMTDAEVKRICQQDEDYQPARRPRYVRPQPVMHDTSTVFAVAFAAFRVLGNQYVKAGSYRFDDNGVTVPVQGNRDMMVALLMDQSKITDFDREMGEKIRTHYKGLMFKILGGQVLNEFDAKSLALANGENVSERDLGTVAYLPAGYERATLQQTVQDRLNDCEGSYVAGVGSKVVLTGEVVKSVYSQQWNTYYITLITDTNHSVFFAFKHNIDAGKKIRIAGSVKNHRDNFQTQLNFVKVI